MADSQNTLNPSAIPQSPSRRTIITAGAAAIGATSVAGLPEPAGAVSAAPMSEALAQAIERHKATTAAVKAHRGPEDLPVDICDADDAAFIALAETPCASDAEFVQKMKYMAAHLRRLFGPYSADPRELLAAISQHTGGVVMSASETSTAQRELVQALYRISGLVDAIYAISDTNANSQIAEGALVGVQKALERETDALLEAAEAGQIIATENVKEAA